MANGGETASRGFIFQAVIALIECLDPENDWDQIKNEPNTDEDKVDIMLYKDGKTKSAIQVKSSINAFERADVRNWLESLKKDAEDAESICLYLVGDFVTPSCNTFIKEHSNEIKRVPFEHLQSVSTGKLVGYIKRVGLGGKVRVDDLDLIDASLFSGIFRNSIAREPVSREDFEAAFQRAIPAENPGPAPEDHVIPQCLTPIPAADSAVGLIGRDDIKKTVLTILEERGHMALVNGLGGIGKTAVMQHICNDLKNKGKYVAWIECGESLKEDLLLLRTELGIPESDSADAAYNQIIGILKADRQLAGNLYLFLDNLSRFLSKEEQGILNGLNIHVMATSRFEHGYFSNVALDVLTEEAALEMFYGYYLEKQTDKTRRFVDAAKEIIRSVQSHTLLVELLAKAASKKGGTLEDFRDDLKKQGVFRVFNRKLRIDGDKNRTIEECVMELYKISGLTPEQQHILKLFTIFTPEKEIFYKIGEWAALDMEAMDQLAELGWLEQGGLENGYQIHQIVRDSLAGQMKRNGGKVELEEYGEFLYRVLDTDSYMDKAVPYEYVRERLVLIEDVARFFDESGRADETAGSLFNNIANVYFDQGNYEKALEYYTKSQVINEQVLGKNHPDTATTYNNMANVYHAKENYVRALEYHEKACAIYEKALGKGHPYTATTYNNMAEVYRAQGNYGKALEYHEKALAIREKVFGKAHPDTATTYNNMANIYYAQGNYGKALEYNEKALAIREKVLGEAHPDTATTYNNIANVYYAQENYGKALEYHEKALAIREKVLGKGHPDTATTYNNMAGIYYAQGYYVKALEYNEKALAIREKVLGKAHPYTAATYNNMALVYYAQGNYEKALEYYEKALAIQEKVLGKGHPDAATTYNNMASVYYVQGNYEKALEYYEKALAIKEKVLGKAHPSTATTYNNMALVYYSQKNYEKALEYFKKAHQVFLSVLGENHPNTQITSENIRIIEQMLDKK